MHTSRAEIYYFNTSHVTVYRYEDGTYIYRAEFQYIPCYGLSTSRWKNGTIPNGFQYIPCYGLSLIRKWLSRKRAYFNTSHVTVYPIKKGVASLQEVFQYIPCYGLSHRNTADIPDTVQFQYIPCYGLSRS